MAFARDVYTAAGGQTDFTISFPYQEQEDVRVYQNGSLVDTADYTFPNATTVRLDTGATASDTIVLQRYTSQATRDVDFTAGPLTENDLDNSAIQLFYMAQEAIDTANENLGKDSAELWDAESTRIVNVGSPTAGTDAVTKDYADALATGALGSPISIANGGTAATTAAAALTNLGAVPVGTNPATGVSYDNGTSGLTATDAQGAIDEIVDEFVPNTGATSYGFYTTVNVTDPDNDIDISAGQCWDTTRASFMVGSAMTKQADAAWAAGTNAGMLDTGSVASDEGYHFYVMLNDVDGSVDYIMSLSDTWAGVTKPTNYTKGQLIGYNYRSGTSWKEIHWSGNYCQYGGGSAVGFVDTSINSQELFTYTCKPVPHNCVGNWFLYVSDDTSTNNTTRLFANYADGTATFVTSSTSFMVGMVQATSATGDFTRFGAMFTFRVNGSRAIMFGALEGGNATLYAYVRGFWLANRLEATS